MTRYQEEVAGMRPLRKQIRTSTCRAYLRHMVKESELAMTVSTWVAAAVNQRLGELEAKSGKPLGVTGRFMEEKCNCG
jgi:hypothetical protein